MSLRDRRADQRIGPLDQQSAADLDVLTRWCGQLDILVTILPGQPFFVDDPSLVDPYGEGTDVFFTRMSLHSLDRADALDAAGETLDDELVAETCSPDTVIALLPGVDLAEHRAQLVAAAEALAIPSLVPDDECGLADAVILAWVVAGDLQDRITTYRRPITVYEWRDFAKLCGFVLARTPIAAAEASAGQAAPPASEADAACSAPKPDTSW